MKSKKLLLTISALLIIMVPLIYASVPYGPTSVDTVSAQRRTNFGSGSQTVTAEAGNMTEITITTSTLSRRWQGYYGNITGAITLDNGDNWTLFSWDQLASPEGEIYASNGTISDWTQVLCMNLSKNLSGYNCKGQGEECLNITEIETFFGMDSLDPDGVDETFNSTISSIMVGAKTLTNCPMVSLYVNSSSESGVWNETLLTLNDSSTIIFAGIVESGNGGFNNKSNDFQMIVGDNGDSPEATTYNFYVELT